MKKSIALLSLLLVSACASNKDDNVVKPTNRSNQNQIEKQMETKSGKNAINDFNKYSSNNPIYFEFDSVKVINNDVMKKYTELTKHLDDNATLTFEGYCDDRGSDEYNDTLGQKRANAVKAKIGGKNSKVISYGKRKFKKYSKDFEENQQANRKVVVTAK